MRLQRLFDDGATVTYQGQSYQVQGVEEQRYRLCDVPETVAVGDLVLTSNGRNALHLAALKGLVSEVRFLCTTATLMDQADNDGSTPLRLAAKNGRTACVALLLERGAAVDKATNRGRTPLRVAALNGHTDCVALLLDRGAAVDKADNSGWTPLYVASGRGQESTARLLLDHGAAVDKADNDGETPLTVAANESMAALLLSRRRPVAEPSATASDTALLTQALSTTDPTLRDKLRRRLAATRKERPTFEQWLGAAGEEVARRRLRAEQDFAFEETRLRDEFRASPAPNPELRAARRAALQRQSSPAVWAHVVQEEKRRHEAEVSLRRLELEALRVRHEAFLATLSAEEATKRALYAEEKHFDCPVCFGSYEGLGWALACGHRFCSVCLIEQAKATRAFFCPTCRGTEASPRLIHAEHVVDGTRARGS